MNAPAQCSGLIFQLHILFYTYNTVNFHLDFVCANKINLHATHNNYVTSSACLCVSYIFLSNIRRSTVINI